MFKKLFILLAIFSGLNLNAADDAISRFVYEYLKRINEFIEENDFENAERELQIFSKRYFLNEQSYERALINQLYGNFYAVQGKYDEAIDKYEASLRFKKMPFVTGLAVKKNLAENKIAQMKEAAIKEIKDASIKVAVESCPMLFSTF